MQSQVKIGKKAKTRAAYWKKFGVGWVVVGLVDYKKYSRFVRGDPIRGKQQFCNKG